MEFGIACSARVAEATTLLADVDGGGAETAGAVLDARVSASTTTAVDSCAGSSLFSSQCRSSSKAVMSAPLVSAKPLCGRTSQGWRQLWQPPLDLRARRKRRPSS
jgi:hypothetical protein